MTLYLLPGRPFQRYDQIYQQTGNDNIRESVDSLCRDGADMPRPPYIGKACTRPNLEDLSLFRYLSNVYESLCTQ